MIPLTALLAGICKRYPGGISRSRLIKTAFLVDWESVRLRGRQLSDAAWRWGESGPTTADVDGVLGRPPFRLVRGATASGAPYELITLQPGYRPRLPAEAAHLVERVLGKYGALHAKDFFQVVYSTYPLLVSRPGDRLDLGELARAHRRRR